MSQWVAIIAILGFVIATPSFAEEDGYPGQQLENGGPPIERWQIGNPAEPYDTGSIQIIDNDLFGIGRSRDADYTAGLAVTAGGRRVTEYWFSLNPLLQRMDRLLGVDSLHSSKSRAQYHAMQIGTLAFTPDDITVSEPIFDDRPYAELVFLSNARLSVHESGRIAYRSTLTFGMLGLGVAEAIQKVVHQITGSADPAGYENQISDGGEPTFRYAVSRHSLLSSKSNDRGRRHEITVSTEGSVGYFTEGSVAISARWGRFDSPWWGFTPDLTDYVARPILVPQRSPNYSPGEFYIWGGVKLRGRLYNSFLQGQIRESPVTYSYDELNHIIGEAWLGVTRTFGENISLSYMVRYQTREIRRGTGAREITWGSLTLRKSF